MLQVILQLIPATFCSLIANGVLLWLYYSARRQLGESRGEKELALRCASGYKRLLNDCRVFSARYAATTEKVHHEELRKQAESYERENFSLTVELGDAIIERMQAEVDHRRLDVLRPRLRSALRNCRRTRRFRCCQRPHRCCRRPPHPSGPGSVRRMSKIYLDI